MPAHTPPPIAPCLWFDDQAEEAAGTYTGLFPGSRILGRSYYPETYDNPGGKPRGSLLTVEFELAGRPFTALNGGPHFKINPTVSFFAFNRKASETDRIVERLADGGKVLMPLDKYEWSPRYAWVQDRFGVSWQVMTTDRPPEGSPIVPCLMFTGAVHGRAEEALRLYAKWFPGSDVGLIDHYDGKNGPAGTLMHGRARIGSGTWAAMDSDHDHGFAFSEAVSFQVLCRDQKEIDHYWGALSLGGETSMCGWLKDRFGVSWQVAPTFFADMARQGKAKGPAHDRAFQAMLEMKKMDLAAIEAAHRSRG